MDTRDKMIHVVGGTEWNNTESHHWLAHSAAKSHYMFVEFPNLVFLDVGLLYVTETMETEPVDGGARHL